MSKTMKGLLIVLGVLAAVEAILILDGLHGGLILSTFRSLAKYSVLGGG